MRRPRLATFSYIGFHRYSLTFCTIARHRVLTSSAVVTPILSQILGVAEREGFALLAYCFMPDHLHLLVEGRRDDANLRRFVHAAKQQSAYEYARTTGRGLWQPSYYDHVLRDEEATKRTIRYILENPIRAGLAASISDYPFLGSTEFTMQEILSFDS